MATYPRDLEQAGLFRDGRSTLIRPIRPEDADALLRFVAGLSRYTLSNRLLGLVIRIREDEVRRAAVVDYHDELALLALLGDTIVGTARFVRSAEQAERAEVTFTVADAFQGQGLGRLLFDRIVLAARARGIRVFDVDVLPDNIRMMHILTGSGYPVAVGPPEAVQHVEVAIDHQDLAEHRAQRREHTAVRRSLRAVFEPTSVAVIGANREPLRIGHEIVTNLTRAGFRGPVYPVNRQADQVAGHRAYQRLLDVPGPVDLAVIAVPPPDVPDVLAQGAKVGVEAAIVVTAGFTGGEGPKHQAEQDLARYARSVGMRMVGPSCMGVINNSPGVRLAATFSPALPGPGHVAMSSQSGPLGLVVLDLAQRLGLGFSGFVSVGDAADVSANDLLQWWEDDVGTSVILLHVERFGDSRAFARIARRLAPRKPIVAVHPGAPHSGAPHSGPPPRGVARPVRSDAVVASLFAQAGVIRTGTLQELFDVALVLAHQPLPRGNRVAVISNAGGPAELTTGACLANGLRVPPLSAPVAAGLRTRLPTDASVGNPVDLTPSATGAHYRDAVAAALSDDAIDAVVVMFMPPLAQHAEQVAEAILDATAAASGKPVIASYLGRSGVLPELTRGELVIPSLAFPESAAVALARAASHQNWRSRPAGIVPDLPGIHVEQARAVLARRGPGWLPAATAAALLDAYGVAVSSAPEPAGLGAFIGVLTDPVFGPVIGFGLTGDYADLMDDVAYRITPLTDQDADDLVHAIRGAPLLDGWRGRPRADVPALKDLLLRISALVEDLPAVEALELRPIRLLAPGAGVAVSRVRVRLGTAPEPLAGPSLSADQQLRRLP